MDCYEFIEFKKDIFYDEAIFNEIKEVIILKLQLEDTKNDDLETELRKNIFIGKADIVHSIIKPLLEDAFNFVHFRYRICLWGIFNPFIKFKKFIEDHIPETIIRNNNKININIPKHIGCVDIDNVLGNWVFFTDVERQMQNYGYSSLKIIQSEGVSLHEFSYISLYIIIYYYIL